MFRYSGGQKDPCAEVLHFAVVPANASEHLPLCSMLRMNSITFLSCIYGGHINQCLELFCVEALN